jgi:predicted Zn-dependent peptidase
MVLCCVGDVDPQEITAIAQKVLPTEEQEPPQPLRIPGVAQPPVQPLIRRQMAVAAPLFMIGIAIPPAANGEAQLRQRLTGELALRCLAGSSSPFYTKLYAEGLLTRNYGCDLDFSAGTATAVFFGESKNPETVKTALIEEISKVCEAGLEPGLFKRMKKAYYGTELRGLGRFDGMARVLAEGHFNGWCSLDAFAMLEDLDAQDCTRFIQRHLLPSHMAMSVIAPATDNQENK